MIDKPVQDKVLPLNDPVPPLHIIQGNDGVDQILLAVVHVVLLGLIQRLGNGIDNIGRRDHLRQSIAFPADNLAGIQPAEKLLFPVGVFQPLDLFPDLQCIGGDRRFHGGQLVLGHSGDDPVHIVLDLRCSIAIVLVDLIADHAGASFNLLLRRQLGQPRADILAEYILYLFHFLIHSNIHILGLIHHQY